MKRILHFKTLPWFNDRIGELMANHYSHGGLRGTARLVIALAIHKFYSLYKRLGAPRLHCPCCGWKGAHFLPYVDDGYVRFGANCPRCYSAGRHRAQRILYERELRLHERQGRVLFFAQDANLDYLRSLPGLVVEISEYGSRKADYHLDILDIRLPDNSRDFVICNHVVEHVQDDRRALRELYRILKPEGLLLLSVPVEPGLEKSIDYDQPNKFETMHWHKYGEDFIERIPSGFEVKAYDFVRHFSKQEFRRFGLAAESLFVCRKRPLRF